MVTFLTDIKKFGRKGEKTGWSYIEIPEETAQELNPGNRKSFRIRGRLDAWQFSGLSLMPMGDGSFILPMNKDIRKAIRKTRGDRVELCIEADPDPPKLSEDLLVCLADSPQALAYFDTLTPGHQRYFSNWIESAKTDATKAKRIAQSIFALEQQKDFGWLLRYLRDQRSDR